MGIGMLIIILYNDRCYLLSDDYALGPVLK